MLIKSSIDHEEAARLAVICLNEAEGRGARVSIAVVDDAGALVHFVRMDGARGHTIDLATRKARSAAVSGVSTRKIDLAVKAGLIGNVESVGWGGVPIELNGACAGRHRDFRRIGRA